jgi:diguanylate cyclase (GGDEF)-like protein
MFTVLCSSLIFYGVLGLLGFEVEPLSGKNLRSVQLLLSCFAILSIWTLLALYVLRIPFMKLERSFIWFFILNFLIRNVAENWTPQLQVGAFTLATDSGVTILMLGIFIALPIKEAVRFSFVLYLGFVFIPWTATIFVQHQQIPLWQSLIRHQIQAGLIFGLVYVLGISKSEWFREQRRNQKLDDIANQDQLTKAANRRGLLDTVAQQKTQYALILFDLDHFKKINDTFGHDIGDTALKTAVLLAKKHLRDSDVIGRWGGEEFLIVLPKASLETARGVAERIRMAFLETREPNFTASFGVSDSTPSTFDTSLKNADTALYQAKQAGRNQVMTASI